MHCSLQDCIEATRTYSPELTVVKLRWSWSFRLVLLFFSYSLIVLSFPLALSYIPSRFLLPRPFDPSVPPAAKRIMRRKREGVDDLRKEGKRERGPRGKVVEGWVIN